MSEHWKGLPLNIGCQESFGVVTESMDEELHMLQSTRTRICQHDAIWSHDVQVTHHHANLCTNMSHIQFESDTLLCNNNLLHIAKYYLLDFTIPFIPLPHFVYGGVLDINIVVVYLLHYISIKRTTVEFVVPQFPQ